MTDPAAASPVWTAFVAALPGPARAAATAHAGLAAALGQAIGGAEAAWPEFHVAPAQFAAALAPRVVTDDTTTPEAMLAALAQLDVAGLYLAHACVLGDARALARFDARCVADLDAALRAAGVPVRQVAEAKQRVRHKLLVAGPDGPPRLAGYAGRGDLRGFVRVVAVREGIDLLRQTSRREAHEVPAADEQLERATVGEDPELLLIKDRHRAVVREAFAEALAQLTSRERNLLRLSVAEGLTIDQLGAAFSVHRATAARWLAAVREQLFRSTRRGLMTRLRIDGREFESLMRVIQSRFEISVCEILQSPPG
jgi:RNA polymerase sigma-70 factor (ECF subfamily)